MKVMLHTSHNSSPSQVMKYIVFVLLLCFNIQIYKSLVLCFYIPLLLLYIFILKYITSILRLLCTVYAKSLLDSHLCLVHKLINFFQYILIQTFDKYMASSLSFFLFLEKKKKKIRIKLHVV
jgi:hypothetical protein